MTVMGVGHLCSFDLSEALTRMGSRAWLHSPTTSRVASGKSLRSGADCSLRRTCDT